MGKRSRRKKSADRNPSRQTHAHGPASARVDPSQLNAMYGFLRARQLEGTLPGEPGLGVWPITSNRVFFGWGCLTFADWDTSRARGEDWPPREPPGLDMAAKSRRIRYYRRVRDFKEFRQALVSQHLPSTSFRITEDWFDAEKGVIPDPRETDVIIGSHAVGFCAYDDTSGRLKFINSWGPEWGDNGLGTLSYRSFKDRSIETWIISQGYWTKQLARSLVMKLAPRVIVHSKPCELMYGLPDVLQGGHSYGLEIYDDAADERMAWALANVRGGFLDIEDLFVRPRYRGGGLASKLCDDLKKTSDRLGLIPRLWVSFADCGEENRPALEAVLRKLDLSLRNTHERWAAYVALPGRSGQPLEPIQIPDRPSMSLNWRKAAATLLSSTIALAPETGATLELAADVAFSNADPAGVPRDRLRANSLETPPASPPIAARNPSGRPRRPFRGFDVECAAFESLKPELLARAEGQYVVLVGDAMEGPFVSAEEAQRVGYARWGLGPLYIKQVVANEPIIVAPLGVVPWSL